MALTCSPQSASARLRWVVSAGYVSFHYAPPYRTGAGVVKSVLLARRVGEVAAPLGNEETTFSNAREPLKMAAKPSWAKTLGSIKRHKGWERSTPTDEQLDHAGGLLGIRFPETYRQFIQHLGAGRLSGWCEFHSCAAGVSIGCDIIAWNFNHKRFVIEAWESADERAKRLIVFGNIWSGDFYGWDPAEVTKGGKNPEEYAIYSVERFMDGTTKLAETFPEFVSDFCMGDGLLNYTGLGKGDQPFDYDRFDYTPLS
jgi:hypothetical protein